MKKSILFYALVIPIIGLAGCIPKRKPTIQVAEKKPEPAPVQIRTPVTPQVATSYTSLFFKKDTATGDIVHPAREVNDRIKKLEVGDLLSCAYDLLLTPGYTVAEKKMLLEECKKRLKTTQLSVVEFFLTVLTKHGEFLTQHPLTDLNDSLVSYAPEHAEFLREDDEITEMLWPIDEVYATGNNLLQEAILLQNDAAVDYLIAKGANPRHLCDSRGTVLALEWVDKHGVPTIASKLAQTLNVLDPDSKTTILDELIYTDSHAAILVRKYGGKLSSELT